MLNLLFVVTLFGPLANFWKGVNCGEGYLRYVKPRIRLRFSKKIESLSMSFHHIDFDFSKLDNDIKVIDDLLINKCLLILPKIKIEKSMIKHR